MLKTAAVVPEEQHFILSSLSPGRAQRRLALAVVLALLVAFFITAGPLSTIQLGRIDALRPDLCHGDVRDRFDHRRPAVCPVLHPAFACPARDREWISLHRAHRHPVDADLSGCLRAEWPAWRRAAEHQLALHPVARRFSHVRDRLCPVEGCRSGQAVVAGLRGCGHPFECCHDRGRRVCRDIYCHSGRCAIAPHQCSIRSIFPPSGSLCCQLSGAVERPCSHRALDSPAFGARSVADGGDVRVCDRDLSDRVSHSGPLQRRLVCRPVLRAPVQQSRAVCPAVRDNDALRAAAPRGPRPTPRARGAADDRGRSLGNDCSRGQAALVRDDNKCRCGLALA